jgi:hypothetical protein
VNASSTMRNLRLWVGSSVGESVGFSVDPPVGVVVGVSVVVSLLTRRGARFALTGPSIVTSVLSVNCVGDLVLVGKPVFVHEKGRRHPSGIKSHTYMA